ncbi:hypothetical protein ACROYT_G008879 [Oculina patagonica]
MADSVQVEEPQRRAVGGTITTGRIHKGHGKTAASASIPSKYQTIVSDNSERKGFLSRSRRFEGMNVTANPGPGTYGELKSSETASSSFSKKVLVDLLPRQGVSQEELRTQVQAQVFMIPQCGGNMTSTNLLLQGIFIFQLLSKEITKKNNFQHLISTRLVELQEELFTTIMLQLVLHFNQNPKDQRTGVLEQAMDHLHVTTQSATSLSQIHQKSPQRHLRKSKDQTGFHNKHYLCISAPAMPLPPLEPMPGPGHYNVVDYEGPPKHYMSSSAFVSTTSRWTGGAPGEEDAPGPATYRPQHYGKQTFIYNSQGRWI